jgi:triphosphoribosyl-dephospho-CoA synthase
MPPVCTSSERRAALLLPAPALGALATRALVLEVELTPKPGLVDLANTGAHRDMDLGTFRASIAALEPWFPRFVTAGAATRHLPAARAMARLRPLGLACEGAMLQATGGVNTHKGGIFSLGLALAALGRTGSLDRERICAGVASLCRDLVDQDLGAPGADDTAGAHLYRAYGIRGARGEAASGFRTVREIGLPAFEGALRAGLGEEGALFEALLHLLAFNEDTNLVHRGGPGGLAHVQTRARALIRAGGAAAPGFLEAMTAFDGELIQANLSPGGSADLLALTWFLGQLPG